MMEQVVIPGRVERTLIVILHAYSNTADSMLPAEFVVEGAFDCDLIRIVRPELQLSLFSLASPSSIAEDLVNFIDKIWDDAASSGNPFTKIVFVGHSVGSLIARKAYVIACGETEDAPFEAEITRTTKASWAASVDRIVLLAGMNRGWRVSHHLSLTRAPLWWLGSLAGNLIELITGKSPLIMQVRLGATFITQLRVQWLRMRSRARREPNQPGNCLTVQLLGSVDDYVSPKDNIDLVAGKDFIYLDVPYSGHANVIEMDDVSVPLGRQVSRGQLRRDVFKDALTLDAAALARKAIIPDDSDEIPSASPEVEDVIFVVHGIRDEGYWTHKVARAIRSQMPHGTKTIATETSSYGYFPMLPFLFSPSRRVKVEWLMDRYATAIAAYPNAKRFHFVGHSNGTYCLAEALRVYPCCKFENVVLAGSVVRREFKWSQYIRPQSGLGGLKRRTHGSVAKVLNFTASRDWVVAIFPKLFQSVLPIQRLGSAGHDGFDKPPSGVWQVGYVVGGHGAAVAEPIWPAIAHFIATGQVPSLGQPFTRNTRTWWVWLAGLFPWVFWLLLIYSVSIGGMYILPSPGQTYQDIVVRLAAFAAYIGLVVRILTWL